jgi:hypothetical protein
MRQIEEEERLQRLRGTGIVDIDADAERQRQVSQKRQEVDQLLTAVVGAEIVSPPSTVSRRMPELKSDVGLVAGMP